MRTKKGFTLLQLIIAVIIVAISAAVVAPQFLNTIERSRATEGTTILWNVLSSMHRHEIEHGFYPSNQASLDITIPALNHFHTPLVVLASCGTGGTCAGIAKKDGSYALRILRNGNIICQGGGCAAAGF